MVKHLQSHLCALVNTFLYLALVFCINSERGGDLTGAMVLAYRGDAPEPMVNAEGTNPALEQRIDPDASACERGGSTLASVGSLG